MYMQKKNLIRLYKSTGDPGQTPRIAASDPGLHCLPLSHKKDARLIWVRKVN